MQSFNHHLCLVHIMPCPASMHYKPFLKCDILYWFLKKPAVTAEYTGEHLKRLLDKGGLVKWRLCQSLFTVLMLLSNSSWIDSSGLQLTELKLEAAWLLKAISDTHIRFTVVMVQILQCYKIKKKKSYTQVKVVKSRFNYIEKLRYDLEFQVIWAQYTTGSSVTSEAVVDPLSSKIMLQVPTQLKQYMVVSTVNHWQQQDRGTGIKQATILSASWTASLGKMLYYYALCFMFYYYYALLLHCTVKIASVQYSSTNWQVYSTVSSKKLYSMRSFSRLL